MFWYRYYSMRTTQTIPCNTQKLDMSSFPRERRFLERIGVKTEGIAIVEYPNSNAYMRARNEAIRKDRIHAKNNPLTIRTLGRVAGFLNVGGAARAEMETGTMHLVRGATVTALHEAVHASDGLTNPKIFEALKESKTKGNELAIRSLIEGRAKFVERLAAIAEEFTNSENVRFFLSSISEVAAGIGLIIMSLTTIPDFFSGAQLAIRQFSQGNLSAGAGAAVYCAICGILVNVGWNVTKIILPYVLGLRFVERVNQYLKDESKTLELTLKHIPTLKEIIFPASYVKRINETISQ
ncbi:hypothetical protein HY988_01970 [Candidatus Micrarchaeota archaeon]|nr:hypothetical protein [Candidatus Micrarchaeota archaeon]